jgi:hypothetical protein
MNTTPKGKIGRLPKAIQDQLNRRLEQGEIGGSLVAWLNSLPEVQQVLAEKFAGKPIREQNLSKWRQRGYAHWLRCQNAHALVKEMIAENGRFQQPGAPPLADQMADWASMRYLLVVRKLLENSTATEPDLKLLREFSRDLVALRRADHSAARLKMEQERLERAREKPKHPAPAAVNPLKTKIS